MRSDLVGVKRYGPMRWSRESQAVQWIFAAAIIGIATAAQWVFNETVRPKAFLIFYPAVFIISLFAPFRISVVSAIVSTVIAWRYFIPLSYPDPSTSLIVPVEILTFLSLSLAFSYFSSRESKKREMQLESELESNRELHRSLELSALHRNTILRYVPLRVAMIDRNYKIILVSMAWEAAYNRSGEPAEGQNYFSFFPNLSQKWKDRYNRCLDGGHIETREELFQSHSGESAWLEWDLHPWKAPNGDIGGIVVLSRNITERKWAEIELANSQASYRKLAESLDDQVKQRTKVLEERENQLQLALTASKSGFWYHDFKQNRSFWDDSTYALFGRSRETFVPTVDNIVNAIHPEDRPRFLSERAKKIADGGGVEVEYRIVWPDKSTHYVLARGFTKRDAFGRPEGITGIVWDVTEQKAREQELKKTIEEKEILLREIHHRVKNNLNIISSLLDLHGGELENTSVAANIRDSQQRIRTMALIHEKLYQSRDLAKIDFQEYVQEVVNYLYNSYGCDRAKYQVGINFEHVNLGLDTAIPCSLIITELVSNALKYAFKGRSSGHLNIRLEERANDKLTQPLYELQVADDGVGLPSKFEIKHPTTLGLKIVSTLARQMGGSFELGNPPGRPGASFRVRFGRPTAHA